MAKNRQKVVDGVVWWLVMFSTWCKIKYVVHEEFNNVKVMCCVDGVVCLEIHATVW